MVVSAIMCILIAGTDYRLLDGVGLESMSWLTDAFLMCTRLLLSDWGWSIIVAGMTAFLLPPVAFVIAVDWLIPGRPITFLVIHGQMATTLFFYGCLLNILAFSPPLFPMRCGIDWVLSFRPGVQRR